MLLVPVAVSGTVGKQVYATGPSAVNVRLRGLTVSPSGANAVVVIRDGNASGTIVFSARAPSAYGAQNYNFAEAGMAFHHGMHVKVLGANNSAYLFID